MEKIKATLDDVAAAVTAMHGDIALMKGDIVTMKGDIVAMKGDITSIQRTMATKEDLKGFATKEELNNVREDLATRISTFKDELSGQIAGLRYAKEIDELRTRVRVVEKKVGI
jgi:hypothetical protein